MAMKLKFDGNDKRYVSNLYFDPKNDELGISYYNKNTTNNDFRTTTIKGLENNLRFNSSDGSLKFLNSSSLKRSTYGHDWCDKGRCEL